MSTRKSHFLSKTNPRRNSESILPLEIVKPKKRLINFSLVLGQLRILNVNGGDVKPGLSYDRHLPKTPYSKDLNHQKIHLGKGKHPRHSAPLTDAQQEIDNFADGAAASLGGGNVIRNFKK